MRQDELRQEKERYQKAQADLSRERERRVLECKICYMQPDHWVTILCGHMVCESCAEKLEIPKSCPICRAPSTGHIKCLPFAG
jgi:rubrerythrin